MQNYTSKFKTNLNERCYNFSLDIIKIIDTLPNKRTAWIIADQLLRSATSIGANLIEAKASSSRREFKKFYEISLKSSNETTYWLNLLKDTNLAELKTIDKLLDENEQLSKMIAASILRLKGER